MTHRIALLLSILQHSQLGLLAIFSGIIIQAGNKGPDNISEFNTFRKIIAQVLILRFT